MVGHKNQSIERTKIMIADDCFAENLDPILLMIGAPLDFKDEFDSRVAGRWNAFSVVYLAPEGARNPSVQQKATASISHAQYHSQGPTHSHYPIQLVVIADGTSEQPSSL
jgi:hypothetical protein